MVAMTREQDKRHAGRPPMYDDEPMGQINMRLPATMLDWLSKEARRQGGSGRTAVIRRLIEAEQARQAKP